MDLGFCSPSPSGPPICTEAVGACPPDPILPVYCARSAHVQLLTVLQGRVAHNICGISSCAVSTPRWVLVDEEVGIVSSSSARLVLTGILGRAACSHSPASAGLDVSFSSFVLR